MLNIVIKRVVSDFCPFYATEDIVFFAITRHRCISSEKNPNQLCVLFKNIIHYTHKQSLKCRPYLNKEYPESEEEDKLDAWQVQEDTVVPYTITDQPDTIRASDWLKVIWP